MVELRAFTKDRKETKGNARSNFLDPATLRVTAANGVAATHHCLTLNAKRRKAERRLYLGARDAGMHHIYGERVNRTGALDEGSLELGSKLTLPILIRNSRGPRLRPQSRTARHEGARGNFAVRL